MASPEEYAKWIVDNQDKQGSPEFATVAQAYEISKAQQPRPQESSFPQSLLRQAGLTARAAGPIAAGAAAGAAMGAPLAGVGAIPGAGAGALAATILQMVDQLGGTNYI